MTVREIVTLPDPVLRRKAHKLTNFDKEFTTLVNDMVETMRAAPGVGLAAPQVGVSERLIVVEFGDEENEESPKKLFVVANPEIVEASDEMVTAIEGCLSLPGLVGEVERHEAIQVKGLNRQGKPIRIKAQGWLARIFQHEIDHLEGVLYPDRATRVWQPSETEEIEVVE
ncbi:MAG: peptide deformylase [Anaerolineaceae bacterium]|nr:peptide deformylase [Anaerolineaceae bacterium]